MFTLRSSPRLRRWWLPWSVPAAITVIVAAALAVFPHLVALPSVQRWLSAKASRILAPGSVHFRELRVSWIYPTQIYELTLCDARGASIVSTPSASFSWNLWQFLTSSLGPATLVLDEAALDIKRSASGSVNLLETLKPILAADPARNFLVRIPKSTLRFEQEGLTEPIVASSAHIELDLNAYPQPIAWRIALEQSETVSQAGSVQIQGSISRRKATQHTPTNIDLSVRADQWPWRYHTPEVSAQGFLTGLLEAHQKYDELRLIGNVRLFSFHATGQQLLGDEPRLDAADIAWDVSRQGGTWTARRLDAVCSIGTLTASGSFPPAEGQDGQLNATLNLAALTQQIPRTLRLHNKLVVETGTAELHASATRTADEHSHAIDVTASLSGLAAQHGERHLMVRDPVNFFLRLRRDPRNLSVDRFQVQMPFLTVSGNGDLDRGVNLTAAVDISAASDRIREWLDLGQLKLTGKGVVDAHYQRAGNTFDLTANSNFSGPSLSGLPIIDTAHCNRISTRLALRGVAAESGLPAQLDVSSFAAQADTAEIEFQAERHRTNGVVNVNTHGMAQITVNGKKQQLTGSLKAQSTENRVLLEAIALTLSPLVGPGRQSPPDDQSRWLGKGMYDKSRDELRITADSNSSVGRFKDLAIAPSRITVAGLKSQDAARFEVNLSGELADLELAKIKPWCVGADSPNGEYQVVQDQSHRHDLQTSQLTGQLRCVIQGHQTKAGWEFTTRAEVDRLASLVDRATPQILAENLSGGINAKLTRQGDQLELTNIELKTPYGHLQGKGLATDLPGTPQLAVRGTLNPDWRALTALLARNVEPKASVSGTPSAWSINGTLPRSTNLRTELLTTLDGEVGLDLEQADIFGMHLGKTALVVRNAKGKIAIDPIDSTLNGGRLHLEPELVMDAQSRRWLHLGAASALLDAVIDDEVSHRVLSFAAPVLDQATRVRGRVSLAVTDAFLPLNIGSDAQAKVDGDVLFDAVEFMPGPFVDQILGVFRQEHRPLLVLRDPVSVRIVGRRIYQEGLVIPVGNVAAIGLDGWVDFDQNLNLNASFAMIPPQRNIPILSDILANAQIRVPITGTFQKPRLNGEAIKGNFKELGVNMLDNLLDAGIGGLGRVIQRMPGRDDPRPDLFPPFVTPDNEQLSTQPSPRSGTSSREEPGQPGIQSAIDAQKRSETAPSSPAAIHRPKGTADVPAKDLSTPPTRLGPRDPEERQLAREQRRLRRLERHAERRARRGLPPD